MTDLFIESLATSFNYFIIYRGTAPVSNGFKLSIQGESLEDSAFLYERLIGFLEGSKCSFKFGTNRLINSGHPQQSKKLLTIYMPNDVDVESLAELVYLKIIDYTGGDKVKQPDSYTHYKNAIYFRNDRDENGEYISAN
jgi:hypothetical protein